MTSPLLESQSTQSAWRMQSIGTRQPSRISWHCNARRLWVAVGRVVGVAMSADAPSTPLRQQGKRLFVESPASALKQAAVGAAVRAFLDSPAVSPPQGPGAGNANPHLRRQQALVGPSTAAATDLEACCELLGQAGASLSSNPTGIMAEEIMAEARRSIGYLQQLRDERADHRRWFVCASEQHAVGRKLAARQLSRQRELRLLARCFSALRVRIDRLARQIALDGWGSRTQRQQLRTAWGHWARRVARWYCLARAYELMARRGWCRTAQVALRSWRRGIACCRRGAVAARRAQLRRLRCWFERWAGQSMRWASIHRVLERSSRLAVRQLECVSRKAIRYVRNRAATCARAWRAWSHRRMVARRLVGRFCAYRSRRVKVAVVQAWQVFVVQQCRHTPLAWHATSVSRRLQNSLLAWHRAANHRRLHRIRVHGALARAFNCSRFRALTRTIFHLKQHATRQVRCRRLLSRTLRGYALMCWRTWHSVTVCSRQKRVVLNRALAKRRQHILTTCLLGWRQSKLRERKMRELGRRSVRNGLRRRLQVWFANTTARRLEDGLVHRAAELVKHRVDIVNGRKVYRERIALSRCLYAWRASHEQCRAAHRRRKCVLVVAKIQQRRVARRSTLLAWRQVVVMRYTVVSSYQQSRRYRRMQLVFSLWSSAVARQHRAASTASAVARRAAVRRAQLAFRTWSRVLIERSLRRMHDQCTERLSNVQFESRTLQGSLRAQMVALTIAKSMRSRRYIILSQTLGYWHRSTRASLRGKIPLLQTAFEIERVALIKGTVLSADAGWQVRVSKFEEQQHAERTHYAQLLVGAEIKLAEIEGQLHACAAELQRTKEKHRRQQKIWKEKWKSFEDYRAGVRRKEADLDQKKEALREWSRSHMHELKQCFQEQQAEKQSCDRAMQAAKQLERAAADSVAAKDHELWFAKCAAAVARREQAEAKDQLVATRALFCTAQGEVSTSPLNAKSVIKSTVLRSDSEHPVPQPQAAGEGGGVTTGDLAQSDEQITQVLSRSVQKLVSVREAEEEAVLSLDYDIESLLAELKKELRLAE